MPRHSEIQIQVAIAHFLSSAPSWCPSPCFVGAGANVEQLPICPTAGSHCSRLLHGLPYPIATLCKDFLIVPPEKQFCRRTSWRQSSKGIRHLLEYCTSFQIKFLPGHATLHLKHHCHLFTEEASLFYLTWACCADVTGPKEQVGLLSWSFSPPASLTPSFLVSRLPRWSISFSTNGSSAYWGSKSLIPCPYP